MRIDLQGNILFYSYYDGFFVVIIDVVGEVFCLEYDE